MSHGLMLSHATHRTSLRFCGQRCTIAGARLALVDAHTHDKPTRTHGPSPLPALADARRALARRLAREQARALFFEVFG
jgi:hypothetical protein